MPTYTLNRKEIAFLRSLLMQKLEWYQDFLSTFLEAQKCFVRPHGEKTIAEVNLKIKKCTALLKKLK